MQLTVKNAHIAGEPDWMECGPSDLINVIERHVDAATGQDIVPTITHKGYLITEYRAFNINPRNDIEGYDFVSGPDMKEYNKDGVFLISKGDSKEDREFVFKYTKGTTITTEQRAELEQLVADSQKLNPDDYPKHRWEAYMEAINYARMLAGRPNTTTKQYQDAVKAVKDALAVINVALPTPEQKVELKSLYRESEKLNAEKDKYTSATWSAYWKAIETYRGLLANENASKDDYAKAIAEITAARDALKLNEGAGGTSPDGNTPGGNTPDENKPDGNKPDGNKPDGSKPDGSKPDGSKPSPDKAPQTGDPLAIAGLFATTIVAAGIVVVADKKRREN